MHAWLLLDFCLTFSWCTPCFLWLYLDFIWLQNDITSTFNVTLTWLILTKYDTHMTCSWLQSISNDSSSRNDNLTTSWVWLDGHSVPRELKTNRSCTWLLDAFASQNSVMKLGDCQKIVNSDYYITISWISIFTECDIWHLVKMEIKVNASMAKKTRSETSHKNETRYEQVGKKILKTSKKNQNSRKLNMGA